MAGVGLRDECKGVDDYSLRPLLAVLRQGHWRLVESQRREEG